METSVFLSNRKPGGQTAKSGCIAGTCKTCGSYRCRANPDHHAGR